MARKAAWEEDVDLGPYAQAKGTNWGRVFVILILVAMATFVAAYYLPLYRAQQKLSEQYRDVMDKSRALADSIGKVRAELSSVTAERDRLQAEHDRRENADKAESAELEHVQRELSTKFEKLSKKGAVVVSANAESVLVAFDTAVLFAPQKLEPSQAGRPWLCDVAKGAGRLPLRVSASMTDEARVPAAFLTSYGGPWGISAARASAIAAYLEEQCAFPRSQLSATGNGKDDPFLARLGTLKVPGERIVLEIRSH